MTIKRITPEDWQKAQAILKTCSVVTLDMAYAVLVEGKRPAQVARDNDRTPQAVNSALKRVKDILEQNQSLLQDLEPVNVWLPPELAAKVREMAAPYMPKE
jgi:hypothetical protein